MHTSLVGSQAIFHSRSMSRPIVKASSAQATLPQVATSLICAPSSRAAGGGGKHGKGGSSSSGRKSSRSSRQGVEAVSKG